MSINIRKINTDLLTFLIGYLISLAPIYVFLFGNGYFNSYNYNTPFFSGLELKYLFTPSVYAPEVGFAVNLNFFYFFLLPFFYLTQNIIILDKIWLIIVFTAIYISLYKLTGNIINVLGIEKNKNLIKIITIIFYYLVPINVVNIAYNFFDFMIGGLALAYILYQLIKIQRGHNISKFDIIKSGLMLGLAGLMDPRDYVWSLYIFSAYLIGIIILNQKVWKSFKLLAGTYVSSLPVVAFTYYIFIYPSLITVSISKAISVSAYRPDTYSYIASWSHNSLLFNVFMFINTGWTPIPYAPISILFYPREEWWYLPTYGNNAMMLLPPSIITDIWLASLFVFFLAMALSLLDKDKIRISAPILLSLLFILLLSAGSNSPITQFVYWFEIDPSHLPIIRGIFGTTWAIPYYVEDIAPLFVPILLPISLNYLLNKKINRNKIRILISGILIFFAVFASWQYFNGTLFPSQVTGAYPGNSISLQGYYAPLYPPKQWVHVMNILSTSDAGVAYVGEIGFSEKWTHYQFISHTPFLMPGYATIGSPSTKYVNQTPLAYDISGTKYLFIDNTSYIPLSNSFIYEYLNYSGLKIAYEGNCVYLLEQPNASVFRYAYEALYFNGSEENAFNIEWLLYPHINYTPAIIVNKPFKNTVEVVLNPNSVNESVISYFNESKMNIHVNPGSYIIINDTSMKTEYIDSSMNVTPNTLIIPSNVSLHKLVSYPINFTFHQILASFIVKPPSNVFVETSLPLPYQGLNVNGGIYLGVNTFNQTIIYTTSNSLNINIKLGFFTDILMILVDLFFYLFFIYLSIYKSSKNQIKSVILKFLKVR
ncbi:hypothetical protein [Sulfurisphaera javensis]|uniref:hypothetical protein n=1 Tax=Sulfurisphaera javensis TaxID=2049879 RepID=UPI0034E8F00C